MHIAEPSELEGGAPAPVFDPRSHGARGDGAAKDTEAIQRAIDACAEAGGGVVLLQGGTFLSGTVKLASRVTLRIAADAKLLGSQDDGDYPALSPPTTNTQLGNCRRALVYAEGADGVRIDGGGAIDGNADLPKWHGASRPEADRPMAVFTALSRRVSMADVTVRNAATWAVVHMEVTHLRISGITVDSQLGPTHDGIDVVDGADVLIEGCTVSSGDDAICLKSGSAKGLSGVRVRGCRIRAAGVANGIKLGTATVGPIHDIAFEDISIQNVQAAALAVESVDGSSVSNVAFRRITIADAGMPFFVLLGKRGSANVGSVDGIRFEAIRGGDLRYPWGSYLSGAPADGAGRHDLSNISFHDVDVTFKGGAALGPFAFTSSASDVARFPEYQGGYPDAKFIFATPAHKREVTDYALPGWAFFIRHAAGVSFSRCRVRLQGEAAGRDPIATHHATVSGTCAHD
jgi:polygalacturonase